MDVTDGLAGERSPTEDGRYQEPILPKASPILAGQSAPEISMQVSQEDPIVFDRALIPVSYT